MAELNIRAGNRAPNDQNRYEISSGDLPLHCPMPEMSLWNSHPRVFLPIEESGEAKCPYCGADYVLKQAGSFADTKP